MAMATFWIRAGLRKPEHNGYAEQFIGSIRRECLAHEIVADGETTVWRGLRDEPTAIRLSSVAVQARVLTRCLSPYDEPLRIRATAAAEMLLAPRR